MSSVKHTSLRLLLLFLLSVALPAASVDAQRTRSSTRSRPTVYRAPRPAKPPRIKPVARVKPAPKPRVQRAPRADRCTTCARDSRGRIQRSASQRRSFMRSSGYAHGRPGYKVDHIKPLACGGSDSPENMQWLTTEQWKAKTRWERRGC